MTENRSPEKKPIEWIIYLINSSGERKPVGIFNGEFAQSQSTVEWIKGGKATIQVLPTSPSETGYKDRLAALQAAHQTIFRIVPNQIGISAGFAGEHGYVYYFDSSAKLMVSGKLMIKKKGEAKTYEGCHSLYIDGVVSIIIRDGLVVIDCRSGELFLDQTLPREYREQMNVQFRDSTQSRVGSRMRRMSDPSTEEDRASAEQKANRDIKAIKRKPVIASPLVGTPPTTPISQTSLVEQRLADDTGYAGSPGARDEDSLFSRLDTTTTRPSVSPTRLSAVQGPQTITHERSVGTETTLSEPLISDEWIEQKDHLGSWFFPKTFFGDTFPSVRRMQRKTVSETSHERRVPTEAQTQQLSDRWTQERSATGTWYFPKTFFGYPFPPASNVPIGQPTYRPTDQIQVSDRWGQERDASGTWHYPKTFFGYPFPQARDKTTSPLRSRIPSTSPTRNVGIQTSISAYRQRSGRDPSTYPMTSTERRVSAGAQRQTQQISDRQVRDTRLQSETDVDFREPIVAAGLPSSPSRLPTSPSRSARIQTPVAAQAKPISIVGQNMTKVHEYIIYYKLTPNILRPTATLIGSIGAQAIVQPVYQRRRNDGTIRTVMLNTNDSQLLRDAATVRHSTDLITVSTNNNSIVKLYGEISGGFAFTSDSVLKINGRLIISRNGTEDQPIAGICSLTVNSGSVSMFICDNNDIILLDEGQNNFTINRETSLSRREPDLTSQPTTQITPMPQTSLGIRADDTGYATPLSATPMTQRMRRMSDPSTKRDRASAERKADLNIRRAIIRPQASGFGSQDVSPILQTSLAEQLGYGTRLADTPEGSTLSGTLQRSRPRSSTRLATIQSEASSPTRSPTSPTTCLGSQSSQSRRK